MGPQPQRLGAPCWRKTRLSRAIGHAFDVTEFEVDPGDADVVVVFERNLEHVIQTVCEKAPVVYFPGIHFVSIAQIDREADVLSQCASIVVHSPSAETYFQSYAPSQLIQPPVLYTSRMITRSPRSGPLLWMGAQHRIPQLVDTVQRYRLDGEIVVLSDFGEFVPDSDKLGFDGTQQVTVEQWTAERQLFWLRHSRAAVDLDDDNFQFRDEPVHNAISYLASGLPYAIASRGYTTQRLGRMGATLAVLAEGHQWQSKAYSDHTLRQGIALRKQCSQSAAASRFAETVRQVVPDHTRPNDTVSKPAGFSHGVRAAVNRGTTFETLRRRRIAVVSLLFNWPSTAGGAVHTAELVRFLGSAGFDVQHICARYAPWRIGNVTNGSSARRVVLEFGEAAWTIENIKASFLLLSASLAGHFFEFPAVPKGAASQPIGSPTVGGRIDA